jgi:RNA polymerase sigma factor (TIGR02999 family)
MAEVTAILSASAQGDSHATDRLWRLVYNELRRLAAQKPAREAPGQSLDPTALVHEAYLRLVGSDPERSWEGRGRFFAAAAEAMRRIVVDRARARRAAKRGGSRKRVRGSLDGLAALLAGLLLATLSVPGWRRTRR